VSGNLQQIVRRIECDEESRPTEAPDPDYQRQAARSPVVNGRDWT
jgi:hypothetical protein